MKRFLLVAMPILTLMLGSLLSGRAQAPSVAQLVAERQEMEEKYKALNSVVQALHESNAALQRRVESLTAELRELQPQVGKTPPNMATQDDIKKLGEKLLDLDRKRIEDNKRIMASIEEARKALATAVLPTPSAPPKKTEPPPPARDEKGYEHVVASGDNLAKIIKVYRDNGIKISQKDVMDANPNAKWNSLKIGQKIWIPAPRD